MSINRFAAGAALSCAFFATNAPAQNDAPLSDITVTATMSADQARVEIDQTGRAVLAGVRFRWGGK